MKARATFLRPDQVYALRTAIQPVEQAFDGLGCYHVGSSLVRADWHDVDVRCILEDDRFCELFGELDQYHGNSTALWAMVCSLISEQLSRSTGLPIDFQIQAQSIANDQHSGRRNGLFHDFALRVARKETGR